MDRTEASRSSVFAARLVTMFLLLAVAFGLFVLARGVIGAVRGGQAVSIHQMVDLDDIDVLPKGAVGPEDVSVTVQVKDASAEQALYAMARDLIPTALAIAILWFLRAVVRSVPGGDPFTRRNVGRLRTIGFILLIGFPLAQVAMSALEQALSTTVGASGSGLAIPFPGPGPIAALFVFVLAQVFDHGVRLREDIEGTV